MTDADHRDGTPAGGGSNPSDPTASPPPAHELQPDDRIGRYLVRQRLGEGGFATVYLAEQSDPVHRRVALKITKIGMDSEEHLARFEVEREALALMDHPHIAKVFDAGLTETGRSYSVMEHVPGEPITDYCDRHMLSTNARLRLFLQACGAVQHAHQRGIIHRDIKPSNVLVAVRDGEPTVKVIDFGVAKATGGRLTEKNAFTQFGQLVGTPEYMSPEQAEMTALDIDTRTDIYSLGVLLYELLVGELPFDSAKLRHAAFGEIQRIIREEEPPKPSTRLSTLGDRSGEIASRHHTNPRSLLRELRGDLDWITMKAMEKDRARRYASASELGADIGRHMRHEPVLAGPPSVWYRLGKFARKNRAAVIAAAVVLLAIVMGMSGIVAGARDAARERDLAEEARRRADIERVKHAETAGFLERIFYSFSADEAVRDMTVAELLHNAATQLQADPPADPEVEATVRDVIGTAYHDLGLHAEAEPHLRRAAALFEASRGAGSREAITASRKLAESLLYQDETDAAEERIRAAQRALEAAPEARPEQRLLVLQTLAEVLAGQERFEAAATVCREAHDLSVEQFGADARESIRALELLCLVLSRTDRDEFERRSDEMWNTLEAMSPNARRALRLRIDSPAILVSMLFGDGEIGLQNAVVMQRGTAWTRGQVLRLADELAALVAEQRQVLGEGHERNADLLWTYALVLHRAAAYERAEPVWRLYLATRRANGDEVDPEQAWANAFLALARLRRGDPAEAESLYRNSIAIAEAQGFDDPDLLVEAHLGLGEALLEAGRAEDAEVHLLWCDEFIQSDDVDQPFLTFGVLTKLAMIYERHGLDDRADEYRQRLQAAQSGAEPPN